MASDLIDAVPDVYGDVIKVSVKDGSIVLLNIPSPARRVELDAEGRDRFARAWMEACRRADGEPPAGGGRAMASDLRMDVQPLGGGAVRLVLGDLFLRLDAGALGQLRELLGRAAMPGQPPAVRHPLYGCCPHCEHCGQCQTAGDCEHGFAQPPHLRPCAFADCEPGRKVIGEAIVTGQPADGEPPAGEARDA